ncbi:hypothetical protein UY3_01643 [Chelonia mydas]|uniref:Uncharacterized protein n=1 Tax=Chelonia mydas TaxID=8469 RepID=M7C943_CHEMY|nr:hypothetical protein UY3_01643 [Chelonia mydas]
MFITLEPILPNPPKVGSQIMKPEKEPLKKQASSTDITIASLRGGLTTRTGELSLVDVERLHQSAKPAQLKLCSCMNAAFQV